MSFFRRNYFNFLIFREQLLAKISQSERDVKNLKEEEKEIAEKQSERIEQAVMWKDLVKWVWFLLVQINAQKMLTKIMHDCF